MWLARGLAALTAVAAVAIGVAVVCRTGLGAQSLLFIGGITLASVGGAIGVWLVDVRIGAAGAVSLVVLAQGRAVLGPILRVWDSFTGSQALSSGMRRGVSLPDPAERVRRGVALPAQTVRVSVTFATRAPSSPGRGGSERPRAGLRVPGGRSNTRPSNRGRRPERAMCDPTADRPPTDGRQPGEFDGA